MAKVIDHPIAPDGTESHSIDVFNALVDTISVTPVPALEPFHEDEVLCALSLGGVR